MSTTRMMRLLLGVVTILGLVRPGRSDAVTSTFNILIPKDLKKPEGYDHRDAMFGIPPYGGSIQQQVYYAGDSNNMCEPLSNTGEWKSPYILFVDRGDCSFVQKVRNAQRAGAAAVLIADDICICGRPTCPDKPGFDEETQKEYFCETQEPIMADDGSGSDISIPSFLLFKDDADPIRESLLSGQHVRAQMAFSVPSPDSRVEYDLWTSPADALTRELQEDFFIAVQALKEHASFTPHMYIYDGVYAGCHGDNGDDLCLDLCSNHGRYCSVDLDLHSGASGAEVVTEALRRICIWNLYGAGNGMGLPWWKYVRAFTDTCDNGNFEMAGSLFSSRDCISKAMDAAGIDLAKIDGCMTTSGGTEADVPNTLLNKELADQAVSGVVIVPSLLVNQAVIRGFLNFETTFKAICAGFSAGSEPKICQECANCRDERKCVELGSCSAASGTNMIIGGPNGVSVGTFMGTLLFLIVFFVVFGYIQYQRQQENMHQQIQSVVAEYMPVTSQNAMASTSLALDEDDDNDDHNDYNEDDSSNNQNGVSSFSIS